MHSPHPLVATFERAIVLSETERLAIDLLPFQLETVLAGEGPCWAGDRPTRCFLVRSGLLATSKATRDGEIQFMALHIPGDMPDLQSLCLEVLDSDIGALTHCELVFVAHKDLQHLVETQPRLAAVLWRGTLVEGSIYRESVVNVSQRQALNRLAHLFCELLTRMEVVGLVQDENCQLGLTQKDLSEATGLSVVDINRTLQDLRARQLIVFEKGRLTILDREALALLGEFTSDYLLLRDAPGSLG